MTTRIPTAPSDPLPAPPAAPSEIEVPVANTRVRITATRVRRLQAAANTLHKAEQNVLTQIDGLLEGRADDESPTLTSLRAMRVFILEGEFEAVSDVSDTLAADFDAFL